MSDSKDDDELIYIGTMNSPKGGTRPWKVTKKIAEKMVNHPWNPENDFERCTLAAYIQITEELLEGFTPGTPEYEQRRRDIDEALLARIEKEQQENGES